MERNHQKGVASPSKRAYHAIFDNFLDFLDLFNTLTDRWEEKMVLYATFLADNIYGEDTIRSYMSAIRYQLQQDGVHLNEDRILLESIVRSTRYKNRQKRQRLGISEYMLHKLLDQVDLSFSGQPYLTALYKAMFTLAFYGLLRVSELTSGRHPILAKNVIAAKNKLKIQITLESSKTHTPAQKKQVIRFPDQDEEEDCFKWLNTKYCPFTIVENYISMREAIATEKEQFFIFKNNIPIKEGSFRRTLKKLLIKANFNAENYNTHSFRIGRANHLMYRMNFSVDRIQLKGRWASGAIWNYFR